MDRIFAKGKFPAAIMAVALAGFANHAAAQIYRPPQQAASGSQTVSVPVQPVYHPPQAEPYLLIQGPESGAVIQAPEPPVISDVTPLGAYSYDLQPDVSAYASQYDLTAPPSAPEKAPPPPPRTVPPGERELATKSGIDLGVQASYYDYQEPSAGVTLSGEKAGFTGAGTLAFGNDYFLTLDGRFAIGPSDYKGSGTHNDDFEDLWDVRALAGEDFLMDAVSLSPYFGIGYRQLYSDDRGISSTGAGGYRRQNQLLYVPIGVKPRIRIDSDTRIATTLEFDQVVEGIQKSFLGDVSQTQYGTVVNRQSSGYGLRADAMWETGGWSAGPFVIFWHLDQSNSSCSVGTLFYSCGWYEPYNHTFEGGFQLRYHFF